MTRIILRFSAIIAGLLGAVRLLVIGVGGEIVIVSLLITGDADGDGDSEAW